MRGPHRKKSPDTLIRFSRHKSKMLYFHFQKAYGSQTQQGVTQDEGTQLTKLRNRSIKWSHDKSKIFHLYFHKVQGPQTQQGGNQNERTPPNMSCDTSITPSGDDYPVVGSVHLFHFQLKFTPKKNRFQMIITTLKMCSLHKESFYGDIVAGCLY